jgi:hypothetical protein
MIALLNLHVAGATESEAPWKDIARADIAAVDGWVRGLYPAMEDPANPQFTLQWKNAVDLAESRSETISSHTDWLHVMSALMRSARDGHVAFRPNSQPETVAWAGLALEKRGNQYIARTVVNGSLAVEKRIPDEAALLGCDGKVADKVLEEHLDLFVANWKVPAERTYTASQLFVDTGNPFVDRPGQCRFRSRNGKLHDIELAWHEASQATLADALKPFQRIRQQRSKIELAFSDDGAAWITLGNLGDYAAISSLQSRLESRRDEILSAPYLVWDLRGNGGGDSSLADKLAITLWGKIVAPAQAATANGKRWRASALSIETVKTIRNQVANSPNPNPGLLAAADKLIPALEAALKEGQPFATVSLTAPETRGDNVHAVSAPEHSNPVLVLTDAGCFSSCINALYMLKRMGAVHVGEPTRKNSIYGESWFVRKLPSGKGMVMLPMAIEPQSRDQLGGDTPDIEWTGAAEDEAGLKAMIAENAAGM